MITERYRAMKSEKLRIKAGEYLITRSDGQQFTIKRTSANRWCYWNSLVSYAYVDSAHTLSAAIMDIERKWTTAAKVAVKKDDTYNGYPMEG